MYDNTGDEDKLTRYRELVKDRKACGLGKPLSFTPASGTTTRLDRKSVHARTWLGHCMLTGPGMRYWISRKSKGDSRLNEKAHTQKEEKHR